MKHAIRAFGWATAVLLILVILFSVTVAYSALQIGMNFEEHRLTFSNGTLTLSIPFSVSNGGLYDISELNFTTRIVGENETVISRSDTIVPLITRGGRVNETHDISVSLDDILAKNLTYMLFNDTDLNVNMVVAFIYAQAISLEFSSEYTTMPWSPPLSNLTIGELSSTLQPPYRVNVPLSFENRALFSLNGTIGLEIVDGIGRVGGANETISVPPRGSYNRTIPVMVDRSPKLEVEVRLLFDGTYLKSWTLVMSRG